jgi:hypothetical protein
MLFVAAEATVVPNPPPGAYRVELLDTVQVYGLTASGDVLASTGGPSSVTSYFLQKNAPQGPKTEIISATILAPPRLAVTKIVTTRAGLTAYAVYEGWPNPRTGFFWENGIARQIPNNAMDTGAYWDLYGVANGDKVATRASFDSYLFAEGSWHTMPGFAVNGISENGILFGNRRTQPHWPMYTPAHWQNDIFTDLEDIPSRGATHYVRPEAVVTRSDGSIRTVGTLFQQNSSLQELGAVRWDGTRLTYLESLSPYAAPTKIVDVNAAGDSVGWCRITPLAEKPTINPTVHDTSGIPRALLWKGDNITPTDLNSLIPLDSGWILEQALSINDAGQIIGYGNYQGQPAKTFLLTPV